MDSVLSIGVAAHIEAASRRGPRYNPAQSPEERQSLRNGIWLCQSCAKLIDDDEPGFPVHLLHGWKVEAEGLAFNAIARAATRWGRTTTCLAPIEQLTPFFIGRSGLTEQISTSFRARHTQVLTGLGGVGKTQAALTYARESLGSYEHILWVVADNEASVVDSWAHCARALGLTRNEDMPVSELEFVMFNWLRTTTSWLAIIDNFEPQTLGPAIRWTVLPPTGLTLVTSRDHRNAGVMFGRPIVISPLLRAESVSFLLKRTDRDSASADERAAADIAAERAYDLPLALEATAAQLIATGLSFTQLLQTSEATSGALRTAVSQVLSKSDEAQRFTLLIIALLSPEGMSTSILSSLLGAAGYSIAVAQVLTIFLDVSLLRLDGDIVLAHRLVQAAVREAVDTSTKSTTAQAITEALLKMHPTDPEERGARPICSALLPHVVALATHDFAASINGALLWALAGRGAAANALYQVATDLYSKASNTLAALHLDRDEIGLDLKARVAALLRAQGEYRRSAASYNELILAREALYGTRNKRVALAYNNLGNTLYDAGDIGGAKRAYERSMVIWSELELLNAEDAALTRNGLGNVLRRSGLLDEAEAAFRAAIDAWISNPTTTARYYPFALNGLGNTLFDKGDVAAAYQQFEAADEAWTAESGLNHPERAFAQFNLGRCLVRQGRISEAVEVLERAVDLRERHLGQSHPLTLKATYLLEDARRRLA